MIPKAYQSLPAENPATRSESRVVTRIQRGDTNAA